MGLKAGGSQIDDGCRPLRVLRGKPYRKTFTCRETSVFERYASSIAKSSVFMGYLPKILAASINARKFSAGVSIGV